MGLLAGLPVSALERTWEATEITPGAAELVATMRAAGARCVLVSGGFSFFTGRGAERLGFEVAAMHLGEARFIEVGAECAAPPAVAEGLYALGQSVCVLRKRGG